MRGSVKRLPDDQIVSDYQSGQSTTHLAEKYGVSVPTICRRLKDAGVVLRYKKVNLPIDDLVADYDAGLNVSYLAYKYNAPDYTIRQRLKEAGVYK